MSGAPAAPHHQWGFIGPGRDFLWGKTDREGVDHLYLALAACLEQFVLSRQPAMVHVQLGGATTFAGIGAEVCASVQQPFTLYRRQSERTTWSEQMLERAVAIENEAAHIVDVRPDLTEWEMHAEVEQASEHLLIMLPQRKPVVAPTLDLESPEYGMMLLAFGAQKPAEIWIPKLIEDFVGQVPAGRPDPEDQ